MRLSKCDLISKIWLTIWLERSYFIEKMSRVYLSWEHFKRKQSINGRKDRKRGAAGTGNEYELRA